MDRRPWPMVLMAILQFLSPLIYIGVAAIFYRLSLSATANEIIALTPDLRKFEIFVLPLILGGLILLTRKWGYYLVIVGSIYLVVRGVMEFFASNETDPVFPLVLSNLLCLAVVAYLVRPKNRSIYFDPRLRWWETSPRYIIKLPASITRVGAKPMAATLQNIAVGGAGLETAESGFLPNEIATLEFQSEGEIFRLKAKIVWEKSVATDRRFLGLQWADETAGEDWTKLRRLVRALKARGTPTTRRSPPRLPALKKLFS